MSKAQQRGPGQSIGIDSKTVARSLVPWWVVAVVICGATLMAVGAAIALIRPEFLAPKGAEMTEAVRIYAGYLVSRNLAIATMLLVTLFLKARTALWNFMILTSLVQFLDAGVDAFDGRWMIVPGVLLLGTAFLAGAFRIFPRPMWRKAFRAD
jgi:hypothetical protein